MVMKVCNKGSDSWPVLRLTKGYSGLLKEDRCSVGARLAAPLAVLNPDESGRPQGL